MQVNNCHNIADFRKMAKSRLPKPLFDYIESGSDDELTLRRNTSAFEEYDLIPSGLADVANIDLSVTIFCLLYTSPSPRDRG